MIMIESSTAGLCEGFFSELLGCKLSAARLHPSQIFGGSLDYLRP
jgi:hypothetical protein